MTHNCINALTRLDGDAPDGLRYWLRHNQPHRCWYDAPRPEWLTYLMSRFGYAPGLVARARVEIDFAHTSATRTALDKPADRPTPLVNACAAINRLLSSDRN